MFDALYRHIDSCLVNCVERENLLKRITWLKFHTMQVQVLKGKSDGEISPCKQEQVQLLEAQYHESPYVRRVGLNGW